MWGTSVRMSVGISVRMSVRASIMIDNCGCECKDECGLSVCTHIHCEGDGYLEAEDPILGQGGVVFGDEVLEGIVAQGFALGSQTIRFEAVAHGVHVDVEAEIGCPTPKLLGEYRVCLCCVGSIRCVFVCVCVSLKLVCMFLCVLFFCILGRNLARSYNNCEVGQA